MLNEFITMRRRHKRAVQSAELAVDAMLEKLAQVSSTLDDDGDNDSDMNVDTESTPAVTDTKPGSSGSGSGGGDGGDGGLSGDGRGITMATDMDDVTTATGNTNGDNANNAEANNNTTNNGDSNNTSNAMQIDNNNNGTDVQDETSKSDDNPNNNNNKPDNNNATMTMSSSNHNNNDNSSNSSSKVDFKAIRDNYTVVKALEDVLAKCKALQTNLVTEYKAVGNAMNKFGKAIDNATETRLSELCAPGVRLNSGKMDDAIAEHLFREGMFDVGHLFVKEAGVQLMDECKIAPFERLYKILKAFHQDDLGPAIAWTIEKKEFLQTHSAHTNLQFRLHCLAYLQILQQQQQQQEPQQNQHPQQQQQQQTSNRHAALEYARTHLSMFPQHIVHVQKLMNCLLYASRLSTSPYASLVHPSCKDDLERALSTEYCRSLGLTRDSLLLTVIRCGTKAIPTLLKATRITSNLQELGIDDALPVEIDVGRDCCFHSIFTCPVSKEEASDGTNVPMILLCGHVLSKQSVLRLPRGTHRFKCPYCPMEQVIEECKELFI